MIYKPSILFIRHAAMGDVLLTTPILRQLYVDYQGNCEIDVITFFPEVFENNPWIRKVYLPENFKPGQIGYEKVINLDLAYERFPAMHIIDAYERVAFGIARHVQNKQPALFPTLNDNLHVNELFKPLRDRRLVVIHIRQGNWPSRNVPIELWRGVIEQLLLLTDVTVVQVGAKSDLALEMQNDRLVNFLGLFSLQQLSLAIDRSNVFLGIDSGTLHIAACGKTKIVSLFSSAHPDFRKPFRDGDKHSFIPILPEVTCYGCQARFQPPITGVVCDHGNPFSPPCRDKFSIDKIVEAIGVSLSS